MNTVVCTPEKELSWREVFISLPVVYSLACSTDCVVAYLKPLCTPFKFSLRSTPDAPSKNEVLVRNIRTTTDLEKRYFFVG